MAKQFMFGLILVGLVVVVVVTRFVESSSAEPVQQVQQAPIPLVPVVVLRARRDLGLKGLLSPVSGGPLRSDSKTIAPNQTMAKVANSTELGPTLTLLLTTLTELLTTLNDQFNTLVQFNSPLEFVNTLVEMQDHLTQVLRRLLSEVNLGLSQSLKELLDKITSSSTTSTTGGDAPNTQRVKETLTQVRGVLSGLQTRVLGLVSETSAAAAAAAGGGGEGKPVLLDRVLTTLNQTLASIDRRLA